MIGDVTAARDLVVAETEVHAHAADSYKLSFVVNQLLGRGNWRKFLGEVGRLRIGLCRTCYVAAGRYVNRLLDIAKGAGS